MNREMEAAVNVYDIIKTRHSVTKETKSAMLALHNKKLQHQAQCVPPRNKHKLGAKRRIHKICKAWLKSDDLTRTKESLPKVIAFLLEHRTEVEPVKASERLILARMIARHRYACFE